MQMTLLGYNSPRYKEMVELRREILRKPLGLDFSSQELMEESEDIFMAAFEQERLLGGCILRPLSADIVKLRQMAVAADQQGKGVGAAIVRHAEEYARAQGFSKLVMNARDTARGFYEKLGYEVEGDLFIEVGIRHYKMWKNL